jgi:hypothetical protein
MRPRCESSVPFSVARRLVCAYDVSMNGQWIGSYSGSSTGSIVVNIDERQEHYQGTAILIEDDQKFPYSVVSFRTANKDPKFQFRAGRVAHPFAFFAKGWVSPPPQSQQEKSPVSNVRGSPPSRKSARIGAPGTLEIILQFFTVMASESTAFLPEIPSSPARTPR